MTPEEIISRLESMADPRNVEGMARFGISARNTLGISVAKLRKVAKSVGKDHQIALQLWDSGIHEARKLAALVDRPQDVTEEQMERWVVEIDSWDICDGCAMDLFDKTPYAYKKATQWSTREEEFVRRAAFALMAALAFHDKKAGDERFVQFLPLIRAACTDERNFVRKAVNWALRQIGKRNARLNVLAIETAQKIKTVDSKAARWIASDALRELTSDKVQQRLKA